jgi:outer membrane protein OmpA-like peptidoglycan-associated protein
MGEAYLALADDANSFQWNPAGLAQLSLPELTLMHLSYFADINYEYVGLGFPWRGQGLGLGLTWLNVAPFNSTLDPNAVQGSAADYSLSGAYALSLSKELQVGVVARTILSNLASSSAFGGSLDTGAIFRPLGRNLSLAVVAQNLGAQSAYESSSDPLPITLRFGAAYHLYNSADERWLNFVVDANKSLDNRFKFNTGLEVWAFQVLALRGGYKFSEGGSDFSSGDANSLANFTAGLGFRYDAAQIDYAFVPLGELGITHRISVSWKFGYTPKSVEKDKLLSASPKFGTLADGSSNGVAFNMDSKKAFGDTPLKDWKVEIRDENGHVVKTLSGTGPVPKNLAWDLKGADGNLISRDRPYKYAVTMRDWNGNAVSTDGFIAKEIRPKELMTSGPKYDAASGGLVFRPKTGMSVGVKEWKLNIRDTQGNILKTISGTGAIPKNLVWKPDNDKFGGTNLLAGKTVQAIKYDLEFKDSRGQQAVVSDQVRFAMNKAEEGSYKLPLPLKEFKVNRGHEVLVAALPNLVSVESGSAKAAPFVMPVPQAGDVRGWRFDITDGNGRVVRSFRGTSGLPENIFWDGLDESGVAVPSPEKARFKFTVLGTAGERETSERKAVRNPFTVAVAEGAIRKITGIWFRFLDSDLQDAVLGKLKEIAALLRRNPNVQVTIQGHAWDEGGPEEELRLSQERADTVLRYLIEHEGLSPRNVSSIGFGSSMPLTTDKSDSAADKNRRVEVIIVSKAGR